MKKIFYEKIGKKFVPTREHDNIYWKSFPKGTHLVICQPNGRTTYHDIDPAYASVIAACKIASEEICSAIAKKSKYEPVSEPITKAQQDAWQALSDAFGERSCKLHSPSISDCVDAGMFTLKTKVEELLTNPSVRLAYEQFLLVSALTKENNHDKL